MQSAPKILAPVTANGASLLNTAYAAAMMAIWNKQAAGMALTLVPSFPSDADAFGK